MKEGVGRSDEETVVPTGADATAIGPPDEEAFPRTFGSYTLHGRVGAGGMSVVYEAEHAHRRRREALKVLHPHLCEDPQIAERFHREVRAMAGLSHDHVVVVYDSGEIDGSLYYTMPLLAGPTLAELAAEIRKTGENPPGARANEVLDRHGVPPSPVADESPEVTYARRIAGTLVGVADALAAMHTAEILHRDMKPGNLMFDDRRRVLIADFGLARTKDQRITATDQMLGTPAYISPEQILPADTVVDGRCDAYALGVSLFELLTLQLPHRGATVAETLGLILQKRARSVKTLNPELPTEIETVVARCLEIRPQDRYADATRLRDDLDAFAEGRDIATKPVSTLRRMRNCLTCYWKPVSAVAAAVLLVASAAAWFFTRPAYVTVRTIPSGQLAINQQVVGATPVQRHAVGAGEHAIVVTREKFHPLELTRDIGHGGEYDVDRVLRAIDPADPEVISLLAQGHGLSRTKIKVRSSRGAHDEPPLALVWPRGETRVAPRTIQLFALDPIEGFVVELRSSGDDSESLQRWTTPLVVCDFELALDEAVRSRLESGRTYEVVTGPPESPESERAGFVLLAPSEAKRVDTELERLARGFEKDDPSVGFLQAEYFLSQGLWGAAYGEAVELEEVLGAKQEVARLALAALQEAGLLQRGPGPDWVTKYYRAARGR